MSDIGKALDNLKWAIGEEPWQLLNEFKIKGNPGFGFDSLPDNAAYIKLSVGRSCSGLTWRCKKHNLNGRIIEDTVDDNDSQQHEVVDYVNSLYELRELCADVGDKCRLKLVLEVDEYGEKSFFKCDNAFSKFDGITGNLQASVGELYKNDLKEYVNWSKVGLFFRALFEVVVNLFDSDRRRERQQIDSNVNAALNKRRANVCTKFNPDYYSDDLDWWERAKRMVITNKLCDKCSKVKEMADLERLKAEAPVPPMESESVVPQYY